MFESRVQKLLEKIPSIEDDLSLPETLSDQKVFRKLSQEHSYLSELKSDWEKLENAKTELEDANNLLKSESDPEFISVLEEEIALLEKKISELHKKVETLLIPPDPKDHANTIIELRAGTGGDEAALFVGDCARMYRMFADRMGWKWEVLSSQESERGGYKEFTAVISGPNVHRHFQYEAGTHRVQRVPETEAQGRVHTSAITVAVLVEPDEDDDIKVDEKDLRIDTYRSSGAGGQHVNTTDSAVRITHLPSGIVVASQEERSQHKNKDRAMRVLKARLKEYEEEKRAKEISTTRSQQVGSGDRSERIRTYNFPQNRVTDHRINLTLHTLDYCMEGDLEDLSNALIKHYRQKQLS